MMNIKQVFEEWLIHQMGTHVMPMLNNFDIEDGYHDETINAMWIGFNAGYEIK